MKKWSVVAVRERVAPTMAFQWAAGMAHHAVTTVGRVSYIAGTHGRRVLTDGDWVIVKPDGSAAACSDAEFHDKYEVA